MKVLNTFDILYFANKVEVKSIVCTLKIVKGVFVDQCSLINHGPCLMYSESISTFTSKGYKCCDRRGSPCCYKEKVVG